MTLVRRPTCFVSMPFGRRAREGRNYHFDVIYEMGIRPAILDAGAEAVRVDQDMGIIYKPIFERIIESDVFVADVTISHPNVFYELGIRHAARKGTTIAVMAASERAPFDVALLPTLYYQWAGEGLVNTEGFRSSLADRIRRGLADDGMVDSPLFMLFDGFRGIEFRRSDLGAEIFLSYAREDQGRVLEVFDQLENRGFRPWIDQRSITPGERWELAIETALRRADFILVFVSEVSASKRGFLRREIRDATDKVREMLDTDIFLVPVRLDDCPVPPELKNFQWVDLFREGGLDRLVEALRAGWVRRGRAGPR